MRISESRIRQIIREEAHRALRQGRRLMEQEMEQEMDQEVKPPDAGPQMRKNAEELSVLDGDTKGTDVQIHVSEMVSKGLFDKGSEDMERFKQDVTGYAERTAKNMYEKAFFMDNDKVKAAAKKGYQFYAFKTNTYQEWGCKDGSITDLQVFAIPTEKGIVTKAFAVLNRNGRRTNIQIYGLPGKDLLSESRFRQIIKREARRSLRESRVARRVLRESDDADAFLTIFDISMLVDNMEMSVEDFEMMVQDVAEQRMPGRIHFVGGDSGGHGPEPEPYSEEDDSYTVMGNKRDLMKLVRALESEIQGSAQSIEDGEGLDYQISEF